MRLPILPTLLVAAAVATMIGLGIWQLQRAEWKEGLIATYEANAARGPVAWAAVDPGDESFFYRRATGFCVEPVAWRSVAGRNVADQPGWSHIASCRTGGFEGPGLEVELGWSKSPAPPQWPGGAVTGIVAPDRAHGVRLVAAEPPQGLQQVKPPSPEATPNNHVMYAMQWFFFAGVAALIYGLALRRRQPRG